MFSKPEADSLAGRIEAILKSIPVGVVIIEKPNGKIVYANDQAVTLYGVDPRGLDMANHSIKLRLYTTDGDLYSSDKLPTSRALLNGERVQNEMVIVDKPDGSCLYANVSAVPLTDEAGNVTAAIGIFEDVTERKKTEGLYGTLLETSFDAFWLTDVEGRFLDVNEAFRNLLGYSREEILKMSISDVEAKESREDTAEHLRKIMLKGSDYFETRYRRKDGRITELQASANYANIAGGRFFGFLHDITRRKRNEQAIKQSEERFKLIAQAAATMVHEFEVESGKTTISFGLKELLGYDVKEIELTNDWWFDRIHPEDRAKVEAQLKRAIDTATDAVFEYRVRHKRGDYRVVHDTAKIVKNEQGLATRIVGGVLDITERKRAEALAEEARAALEKERDLLQAVMNGSKKSHLVYLDRDFNFVRVNEAYAKTCGYSPEEMIGKNHFALYPHQVNEAIFAHVRETGVPVEFHDKPFVFPDQPERGVTYWDWTLEPIKNSSGEVEGLIFSLVETTERRHMEKRLGQYSKHLENLVEEKTKQLRDAERLAVIGQTAGMVGHDIRNPLQSIFGDIYLVKAELDSLPESEAKERLKESCEAIEKSVDYVNKIVLDLQDYAKPLKPVLQEAGLEDIIEDLLLKYDIPKCIKASTHVANGAKKIKADPTFLKRILGNLMTNAVQAMASGGNLTINARREATNVVITVQDTGVGIPEEVKSKLFTPLFTTKSKGQGFGLAVVKRLVEALNGTITFESKEGEGTTFTIKLPHLPRKKPSELLRRTEM